MGHELIIYLDAKQSLLFIGNIGLRKIFSNEFRNFLVVCFVLVSLFFFNMLFCGKGKGPSVSSSVQIAEPPAGFTSGLYYLHVSFPRQDVLQDLPSWSMPIVTMATPEQVQLHLVLLGGSSTVL